MTRHQRRKLARKRKDAKAVVLERRALLVLQTERIKLSFHSAASRKLLREGKLSPPETAILKQSGKRTPSGLVSSIYSGAANPLGFTRPLTWTKGAAKA